MPKVKKDVIVVAREGYSVLLDIDGRTLDISCHDAINLSSIFSADIIDRCSSLATHLRDGNLIFFKKGTELSKDTVASTEIKPLREEAEQHITSQYEQAAKDARRTDVEIKTRANITAETSKHIQKQVQEGKKEILQVDQKLEKVVNTVRNIDDLPKERQNAMTPVELSMKVSMDVSPEMFDKKQAAFSEKLVASEEADNIRAEKEIAEQESNEE